MIEMFDMIVRNVSLTVTKIRIANVIRHEKPIDMQSSLDLEWCTFLSAIWLPHGQLSGHYLGESHTRPMLISAFVFIFDPKVTGSLVTKLGH